MISKKYYNIVFAFLMASCMAFIMSGVMTLVNLGFGPLFIHFWMKAFGVGFSVAFPSVLIIAPIVRRVTNKLCVG